MPRPFRLLALTDALEFGGAELCLAYLVAELDPAIDVAVAGPDPEIVRRIAEHRPGTPVAIVAADSVRDHVRAIRGWRADLVHVNRSHLYAAGAATLAGRLVPGAGTLAVEHLPHQFPVGRRAILRRRALNRLLDAHVSVGERAARMVEEILGQPAGSVQGIANGVPPVEVEPVARPATGPLIGSLGRLTEQKGYEALVQALPALPDATLVLVGDGPERAALEALAGELGVGDRMIVTGWTSEARRWLPALDVFALPSRWEGLPLVILEAMHAGLPVVACDVGSVAEAVLDGETGYAVAPGDQAALERRLAALVADPELRARLGARGREVAAERFTSAAMARRYEAAYRRIISRSSAMRTTRNPSSSAG